MGDPAGIGPEIIAKAFRDTPSALAGCFVAGDVAVMRRAAACLRTDGPPGASGTGMNTAIAWAIAQIQSPDDLSQVPPRCLPVLQVPPAGDLNPLSASRGALPAWGQISATAGQMAGQAVVWAARAALRGEIAALVTAPLHKEALALAGPPFDQFPGHTELLQAEAAAFKGLPVSAMPVRMMLANDELRTVLVSIHLSLQSAIHAVTRDSVQQTLQIAHDGLSKILGRVPHLGVAGLNPHAGEGGLFGREELDIIGPAISAARARGLWVSGPFAPDTVFMRARARPGSAGEFDAVIAMYHDQGLIPVKYMGVEHGVNVTLGLPLVRTSPDHGTAFDIAGQGLADAASLVQAVRVAKSMAGWA